jgi:uncharacterized membrane-anchored protein YhcB (DUF1043 family)
MMSYPPSDYGSPSPSGDFNRSEETWKEFERNPLPLILFALVIGALIGALLKRRQQKPKAAVEAAREWLDAAYAQLAEKLPQVAERLPQLAEKLPRLAEKFPHLAEKLPQPKPTALWCQALFLDQARQAGKKLKWW